MASAKGKQKIQRKLGTNSSLKTSHSTPASKSRGPPPTQQKTKSAKSLNTKKPKKKEYTAEQLGVPKLNAISPVGVQKPRGKKKGKVFVDDPHTMQTILAMVNAETEGKIESKMTRARQMEEIREARQKEAEFKEKSRQAILEDKKDELRRARKNLKIDAQPLDTNSARPSRGRKKVSFE